MPIDTPALEPRLISDVLAARLTGISRSTWQRLFVSGKTPASLKLGRKRLWNKAEIERWIEAKCPDRRTWEAIQSQARRFSRAVS
jgi:excisionase family DNA binding protein